MNGEKSYLVSLPPIGDGSSTSRLAARNAARRASAEQVETMAKFVALMEQVAADGGEPDAFQHLRIGFARALFAAAGPVRRSGCRRRRRRRPTIRGQWTICARARHKRRLRCMRATC